MCVLVLFGVSLSVVVVRDFIEYKIEKKWGSCGIRMYPTTIQIIIVGYFLPRMVRRHREALSKLENFLCIECVSNAPRLNTCLIEEPTHRPSTSINYYGNTVNSTHADGERGRGVD